MARVLSPRGEPEAELGAARDFPLSLEGEGFPPDARSAQIVPWSREVERAARGGKGEGESF